MTALQEWKLFPDSLPVSNSVSDSVSDVFLRIFVALACCHIVVLRTVLQAWKIHIYVKPKKPLKLASSPRNVMNQLLENRSSIVFLKLLLVSPLCTTDSLGRWRPSKQQVSSVAKLWESCILSAIPPEVRREKLSLRKSCLLSPRWRNSYKFKASQI